jgi:hypothetical protein
MLILAALIVLIVVCWLLIGPRILPPPAPASPAGSLDGRWTATPDDPRATTLMLDGAAYAMSGRLEFTGSGAAAVRGAELSLAADPACPEAIGRYAVELGDVDRYGLLPKNRAQTMSLALVDDPCANGSRADTLTAQTWVLRASGREDARGVCDPPNEEAAITGHWPEPPGCS